MQLSLRRVGGNAIMAGVPKSVCSGQAQLSGPMSVCQWFERWSVVWGERVMETPTREMVMDELADLPEIGLFEVLDFVRFLKSQWSGMNSDERFDRAWMVARRFAAEQGITDEDIAAQVALVRRESP
jgi:hypothetical protein